MEFTFIKKCNSIIFNGIYKETTPTEWNAIVYRIYYNVEWNSFVLIGIQYFSMEWSLLVLIERNILLWNGVQLHWVTFNNIEWQCAYIRYSILWNLSHCIDWHWRRFNYYKNGIESLLLYGMWLYWKMHWMKFLSIYIYIYIYIYNYII